MSENLTVDGAAARPRAGQPRADEPRVGLAALEPRRKLQLALAVVWLFDGILQYQPSMFSGGFPRMLAGSAQGNPAVVAAPITWSASFIDHHLVVVNAVFATIQVALGLGIAWRPTVKLALGASVAWALGVWWFGEGFGGVLTGTASPISGAPGAVILYAVLAVLLWPADQDVFAPFVAGRAVGRRLARLLWLVVWGSLAVFALLPAARMPRALSGIISSMAPGEPSWLAWIDSRAASTLSHQGLVVSLVFAAAFVVVAASVFLPVGPARAVLVLGIVIAAVLWLAQGMGGIFTGSGTDPNSGPLLALLALAFWPVGVTSDAGA